MIDVTITSLVVHIDLQKMYERLFRHKSEKLEHWEEDNMIRDLTTIFRKYTRNIDSIRLDKKELEVWELDISGIRERVMTKVQPESLLTQERSIELPQLSTEPCYLFQDNGSFYVKSSHNNILITLGLLWLYVPTYDEARVPKSKVVKDFRLPLVTLPYTSIAYLQVSHPYTFKQELAPIGVIVENGHLVVMGKLLEGIYLTEQDVYDVVILIFDYIFEKHGMDRSLTQTYLAGSIY